METLFKLVPETIYNKDIFTLEEVKQSLLEHRPKGLNFNPYSQNKFCILIDSLDNDQVSYRYDSSTDKAFHSVSWQDFYKAIKGYIPDISFESKKYNYKFTYKNEKGVLEEKTVTVDSRDAEYAIAEFEHTYPGMVWRVFELIGESE